MAIDSFVAHLAWVKVVSKNLMLLNQAGHFQYRSFSYALPLSRNWQQLQDDAKKLEDTLASWQANVAVLRSENYFLNYFR